MAKDKKTITEEQEFETFLETLTEADLEVVKEEIFYYDSQAEPVLNETAS